MSRTPALGLYVRKGLLAGQFFPLDPSLGEVAMGRDKDCGIVLPDARASRRHARLVPSDGAWILEDLGSRNGTFLNIVPVRERQALQPFDVIVVGTTEMVLMSPGDLGVAVREGGSELTDPVTRGMAPSDIILGSSDAVKDLVSKISLVATGDVRVLLTGETGSGKELAARAIHSMSRRRKMPFVTLNCGAIPADLADSELFGHVKGAFTGAHEDRKGRFEEAQRGTLFLDEVAELTLPVQASLLRVLEDGLVRRVGGTRSQNVDVRVVAATHRNLREAVRSKLFREDLYHRLAVVEIRVPPLRERRGDIGPLARHMIVELSGQMGRRPPALSRECLARLVVYDWPGNVRELRNVLENGLTRCKGGELKPQHLHVGEESVETAAGSSMAEMEKRHIAEVLASCGGHRVQAAKVLKISRSTLYEKMKVLGIE